MLIIGGGPIGLATAVEAARAGLSYRIIEKGTIANSIYNYPLYMQFFSTADRLEIAEIPFITTSVKPGRKDALEYYQAVARTFDLNINLYEKVLKISKFEGDFRIETSKGVHFAKNVVIATGFYDIPNLMNIPGEELPKVRHYYTEPYPYVGQKVAVIGASNSAVDVALEIFRKGGEVTMIVRSNHIGESVKYWVKPDIENRILEGKIKAHFGACVTEITEHTLIFRDRLGRMIQIENDFVFAMTGYLPDFEFLKNSGIILHGSQLKPVYNPDTMESNVEGLYLAGVVCGGRDTHLWFIENSRQHAKLIVNDILRKNLNF